MNPEQAVGVALAHGFPLKTNTAFPQDGACAIETDAAGKVAVRHEPNGARRFWSLKFVSRGIQLLDGYKSKGVICDPRGAPAIGINLSGQADLVPSSWTQSVIQKQLALRSWLFSAANAPVHLCLFLGQSNAGQGGSGGTWYVDAPYPGTAKGLATSGGLSSSSYGTGQVPSTNFVDVADQHDSNAGFGVGGQFPATMFAATKEALNVANGTPGSGLIVSTAWEGGNPIASFQKPGTGTTCVATIAAGGTNYAAADTITLTNGAVITVDTVSGGAVATCHVTTDPTTPTTQQGTLSQASTSGAGSGAQFNLHFNYSNAIAELTAGASICATKYGKSGIAYVVNYVQGESDTSQSNWYNGWTTLANNLVTDIKTATGQSVNPKFLLAQVNKGVFGSGAETNVCLGQLQAQQNRTDTFIGTPMYPGPVEADGIHATALGRMFLFAAQARAERRLLQTGSWSCPVMSSAVRTGTSVVVTFTGTDLSAQNPLTADTDWISAVCSVANLGFTWGDSTSSATVTAASITAYNQVTLTLSNTPTGSSPVVNYALALNNTNTKFCQSQGLLYIQPGDVNPFYNLGFAVPKYIRHYAVRQQIASN